MITKYGKEKSNWHFVNNSGISIILYVSLTCKVASLGVKWRLKGNTKNFKGKLRKWIKYTRTSSGI